MNRFSLKFLRRHVLILCCLLLSLMIFMFCVFAAKQFWGRIERDFQREISNISRLLANHFDSTVRHVDGLLLNLVSEITLIDIESSGGPRQIHQLLKLHLPAKSSSIVYLGATDKNGIVIATGNDHPAVSVDVSSGDTFRFHANEPNSDLLYISPPSLGHLSKQRVILFSRALKNRSGEFVGTISASYKLEDFVQLIDKLDIKEVGLVGIAGRDSIVRVRSFAGQLSYGDKVRPHGPIMTRVNNGEKEGLFTEASVIDQKVRIGYFAVSELSSMIIYVGYDYSYLQSEYFRIIVLLGVLWLVISTAIFGSFLLFRRFEYLNQQQEIELLKATSSERQTILAQMHDSIGSSLAVLISHLNRSTDWLIAKRKATQILAELRFLVDSVSSHETTIDLVLASVRHRMQSGFEQEGLKLIWKVEELPRIPMLSAQCALHLRLILMEALTNILQHAKAKSIIVSATYDKSARVVTITVADDGCGIALETLRAGHGLHNIKTRTKRLAFPSTVNIDSKPGQGTTVQLKIEWTEL